MCQRGTCESSGDPSDAPCGGASARLCGSRASLCVNGIPPNHAAFLLSRVYLACLAIFGRDPALIKLGKAAELGGGLESLEITSHPLCTHCRLRKLRDGAGAVGGGPPLRCPRRTDPKDPILTPSIWLLISSTYVRPCPSTLCGGWGHISAHVLRSLNGGNKAVSAWEICPSKISISLNDEFKKTKPWI